VDYDTDQTALAADLVRVRRILETNLLGAWIVAGAFAPGMSKRGWGRIRGGPARSLPGRLVAPKTPGIYRLDFGGINASHNTLDKAAGWFVVSAKT
jgi:hypothetical protein